MTEAILDAIIDSIKILPFLFITYLLMEYLEHKTSEKTKNIIKKSGRLGPIIGGLLGAVPQCGFSVSATNLYAGRVITLGTLIAIYLSTSDEMLPILFSSGTNLKLILNILVIKILIGIMVGLVIDFIYRKTKKNEEKHSIHNLCEHEHCHCEEGIIKSSIKHTIQIFIFILVVSLILNMLLFIIGEERLSTLILNKPILGPILAGIIGLIPNCASSVILTELFVSNVIGIGTLIGGLLVNSGLGIIVLFKVNKNLKENIKIVSILYAIGVIAGIIIELI
ncbi:MAG: putative manganese transporter [Clostridia bacterium]